MKVQLLGRQAIALEPYLGDCEHYLHETRTWENFEADWRPDFIISYGYPHIIKEPWLSKYKGRMINLHISLLPWNRGADPNYWSWHDDTPQGVSIHEIDSGLDTGRVIARQQVMFPIFGHTLRTSYDALHAAVIALFSREWPAMRSMDYLSISKYNTGLRQFDTAGSFHRKGEMPHLPQGWDTPVSEIINAGRSYRAGKAEQHKIAAQGSGPISWNTGSGVGATGGQSS